MKKLAFIFITILVSMASVLQAQYKEVSYTGAITNSTYTATATLPIAKHYDKGEIIDSLKFGLSTYARTYIDSAWVYLGVKYTTPSGVIQYVWSSAQQSRATSVSSTTATSGTISNALFLTIARASLVGYNAIKITFKAHSTGNTPTDKDQGVYVMANYYLSPIGSRQ